MVRKTHQHLILVTCITSALGAIIGMVSLGTEQWVSASTEWAPGSVGVGLGTSYVNYGLFAGAYERFLGERRWYQITMTCLSDSCAMLCRDTVEGRELQLQTLLDNVFVEFDGSCPRIQRNIDGHYSPGSFIHSVRETGERTYISHAIYACTLTFLVLAIAGGVSATFLSIWNTIGNPIYTVFNVTGIMALNACAATSAALTMILWGVQYNITLIENVGVIETITKQMNTFNPALGYSYWINMGSILLYSTSLGLIVCRQLLLAKEPQATNVEMLRSDDRTIVLF